jgi:hypothetical protein
MARMNWPNLKTVLLSHFMNQNWFIKQRRRARDMRWRCSTHPHESPTAYFTRKLLVLRHLYDFSDAELLSEIFNGAPEYWHVILGPKLHSISTTFSHMKDFEETLSACTPLRSRRMREEAYAQENKSSQEQQ